MVELRGSVYESFGCVELHFAGVCHSCRVVGTVRARVYPKDERVMWLVNDGWVERRLTAMHEESRLQWAWRQAKNTMLWSGLGMTFAIAMSYATSDWTWKMWVYWVGTYVGINVFGFLVYWVGRR